MQGTRPSEDPRRLLLNEKLIQNERITTSAESGGQVLFLDQTTLTLTPNSDIILDKYVFDPAADKGELAVTMLKGAMRMVGGRITKSSAATIRTPSATIGIRGGIGNITVNDDGSTEYMHIAGFSATITNDADESITITREGGMASVSPPAGGVGDFVNEVTGGVSGGADTPTTSVARQTEDQASSTGGSQNGGSQNGGSQNGGSQNGAAQSGGTQSDGSQNDGSQNGATQNGAAQSGAAQSGAAQSGAAQSGGSQSGNSASTGSGGARQASAGENSGEGEGGGSASGSTESASTGGGAADTASAENGSTAGEAASESTTGQTAGNTAGSSASAGGSTNDGSLNGGSQGGGSQGGGSQGGGSQGGGSQSGGGQITYLGVATPDQVRAAMSKRAGAGDGGSSVGGASERIQSGAENVERQISARPNAITNAPISTTGERQENDFAPVPVNLDDRPVEEFTDNEVTMVTEAEAAAQQVAQELNAVSFNGVWSATAGLTSGGFAPTEDNLAFRMRYSLLDQEGFVTVELPGGQDGASLTTFDGATVVGDRFLVVGDDARNLVADAELLTLLGGDADGTALIISPDDIVNGSIFVDYEDAGLSQLQFVDGQIVSLTGQRLPTTDIRNDVTTLRQTLSEPGN